MARLRSSWPPGSAGKVLLGLVAAGILLRLVAIASLWPTTTTLDDGYQLFADSNPFDDPQHPAGYAIILGVFGTITREVAVPVLIQHVGGIASGLLLFAATRRLTGSNWAGLLPAAIVLLNPDQIFLEQAIMSESWAVLVTSIGLYAAVRAFDEPDPWWRWPLLCGAALGAAVTIRTAGLLVIPVVMLALLLIRQRPFRGWREHWRGPTAAAAGAAAVLLVFATANAAFSERFGVGPSSGWYLYGRVAQFADCNEFDPPRGTDVLCDNRPADERPGASYYLFNPEAPAPRTFGGFGEKDELIGEWAGRAVRAQPSDFMGLAWEYLRGYWVPGLRPDRPDSGGELDPQLDFTFENPFFAPAFERNLETFYDDFTAHRYEPGLDFLRGWQQVGRFGGIALSIATILLMVGLFVGTRRSRVGVLLFGASGVALIIAPALTGNYVGRYVVPMAGPMIAAAAIALYELTRRYRARGHPSSAPNAPDLPQPAPGG